MNGLEVPSKSPKLSIISENQDTACIWLKPCAKCRKYVKIKNSNRNFECSSLYFAKMVVYCKSPCKIE